MFQHLRSKYGFVPNAIDVIVEPGNGTPEWTGTAIGNVIVATAQRFQKEGLAVPDFIAPSGVTVGVASNLVDQVMAVPGARST